jgi:hypothetical protein
MPTLQNYITETQRLLHDGSAQYWTISELTDYINDGRNQVVCDTGVNRLLQKIYLSYGVESYGWSANGAGVTGAVVTSVGANYSQSTIATFTGGGGTGATANVLLSGNTVSAIVMTNAGTGYTSAPTLTISDTGGGTGANATPSIISINTIDILNVSIIWGTQRIAMDYLPWTPFNSRMRVWNQILSRPGIFSIYGQNSFFLGPIPDQYYLAELDTVVLPNALSNLTDIDVLSQPYSAPVSYYAAYKAKLKEQSFQEAAGFKDTYISRVKDSLRQSYTRRIPQAYSQP